MPELPEVETVRRGLAPYLAGQRLKRARANRPDLRFPLPPRFAERLSGVRIQSLSRRAKYLMAPLDSGDILVMHLGMSGRFLIHPPANDAAKKSPGEFFYANPPDPKHTHIVLETQSGARIEYNDPRRFGYMDLIAADDMAMHPWFRGLGPEPLGEDFTAALLAAVFKGR
ncbi:MAG: DNA-formamidopyrimidine glycosylase family protein [Hyphomonadaceae bacterium]